MARESAICSAHQDRLIHAHGYRGKLTGAGYSTGPARRSTTAAYAPMRSFVEIFRRARRDDHDCRGPRADGDGQARAHCEAVRLPADRGRCGRSEVRPRADRRRRDGMYADFLPLQKQCLPEDADLIPGVCRDDRRLAGGGIKIGSSTGLRGG